jgi:hypothetical protein
MLSYTPTSDNANDQKLKIWLSNQCFYTGQKITGAVLLNLDDSIAATKLTIGLVLKNDLISWERFLFKNRRFLHRNLNVNKLAEADLTLAQFNSIAPSGKTGYNFSFDLPENLPPSITLKSEKGNGLQAKLVY